MQLTRLALVMALVGCASEPTIDGRDDAFVGTGKADGQIAEGSRDARGVLDVVNQLSEQELDDEVELDARAVAEIVSHRAGPDAQDGTADDDRFDTLAELDAVPYIGPVAFEHLLSYAQDHGFIDEGPPYEAVFSIAADDVWAVGNDGLVEHFDGATWTKIPSGSTAWLTSVWASGPDDVWISGYAAAALHWDGAALTKVDVPVAANVDLLAISGSGPDHVWFVGGAGEWGRTTLRWNGSQFESMGLGGCQAKPSAVNVVSKTDVWVGGLQETVCHFDGTGWTDVGIYLTGYPAGVTDIWGAPSGAAYANVDGALYTRPSGGAWSKMYAVAYHDSNESWNDLRSFVPFAENDIWVTGRNGHAAHYNGANWQLVHIPGAMDYYEITGTSSNDLWAVGPGARAHYDGTTWTESLPGL